MEKKQRKKFFMIGIFAFLIAVSVSLSFTACGEKKDTPKERTRSEYIYQPAYQSIAMEMDYVQSACKKDDRIYMYGSRWVESKEEKEFDYGETYYYIVSCNIDGSDLQEIEIKELREREHVIMLSADDQNRLLLVTQEYEYNDETEEEKEYCRIHILDEKGKFKDSIELKPEKKNQNDYFYLDANCLTFSNGMTYAAMNTKVYCFNEKGKTEKVYEMEEEGYIQSLIQSADGKFYLYCWINKGDEDSYVLREFNPETGTFGDPTDFGEYRLYSLSARMGEGNKVFTNDGNNVYVIDLSSGKLETELNWLNSDVDGYNINEYFPLEDGKFLAISSGYDENKKRSTTEFITLNKIKSSEVKEKKILIYASASMDYNVKSKILEFNKTNENYRIEVRDYSAYEDAPKQLNLDIVSGKIPDILDVGFGVSKGSLVKKGLFLDLYPLIEQDSELSKEDFIPSILNTMEVDGKLYFLPMSFSIQGFLGSKKIFGDMEGWTVEEMIKMYQDMPKDSVFMQDMSKDWFIYNLISGRREEYIDWISGEVKFNTDGFINLIEFSKTLPSDEELYSEYAEDSLVSSSRSSMKTKEKAVFLTRLYLYDPMEIMDYQDRYKKQGGYKVLSYPASDKSNKLSISLSGGMQAITNQCAEPEGAWQFIRQFLTYDYQKERSYSFSIRQDVLDRRLRMLQAKEAYIEEDGTEVQPVTMEYGYEKTMSKKEATVIRSLIERIGAYDTYDVANEAVHSIVNEELQAFYAGDKTAEETAEVIQSRVKIYVSENS